MMTHPFKRVKTEITLRYKVNSMELAIRILKILLINIMKNRRQTFKL